MERWETDVDGTLGSHVFDHQPDRGRCPGLIAHTDWQHLQETLIRVYEENRLLHGRIAELTGELHASQIQNLELNKRAEQTVTSNYVSLPASTSAMASMMASYSSRPSDAALAAEGSAAQARMPIAIPPMQMTDIFLPSPTTYSQNVIDHMSQPTYMAARSKYGSFMAFLGMSHPEILDIQQRVDNWGANYETSSAIYYALKNRHGIPIIRRTYPDETIPEWKKATASEQKRWGGIQVKVRDVMKECLIRGQTWMSQPVECRELAMRGVEMEVEEARWCEGHWKAKALLSTRLSEWNRDYRDRKRRKRNGDSGDGDEDQDHDQPQDQENIHPDLLSPLTVEDPNTLSISPYPNRSTRTNPQNGHW